jgi:putative IMPACT (imprinted ancient) family translation regulator
MVFIRGIFCYTSRFPTMADYKTIRGTATFEYEEKRSRFIATASFADTEEKALAVLNAVRAANRTARHNVYAYVLQNGRTRYSDDGEPAKTAGTPVLETIGHAGVADVIVVVTRYFGGILLGLLTAFVYDRRAGARLHGGSLGRSAKRRARQHAAGRRLQGPCKLRPVRAGPAHHCGGGNAA